MQFIDNFDLRYPGLSHAEVAAQNSSSFRSVVLPTGNVSDAEPVQAFVDGSRWIARCPNPVCGGAERVNFETGVFFCCECRNAAVGHDYIRVAFPARKTRDLIEGVLLRRPDWRFRAWLPGETVNDLKAQNLANGIV